MAAVGKLIDQRFEVLIEGRISRLKRTDQSIVQRPASTIREPQVHVGGILVRKDDDRGRITARRTTRYPLRRGRANAADHGRQVLRSLCVKLSLTVERPGGDTHLSVDIGGAEAAD